MAHRILTIVITLLTCMWMAWAQGNSQGKGKGKGKDKVEHGQPVNVQGGKVNLVFSTSERRMILDYYNPGGKGLPPGLAKRGGDLPPGLEKHLRRNGPLPPGLDKKLQPFPVELERRFQPLCYGCRRGVLGTTAVILSAAGAILDVIDMAIH